MIERIDTMRRDVSNIFSTSTQLASAAEELSDELARLAAGMQQLVAHFKL